MHRPTVYRAVLSIALSFTLIVNTTLSAAGATVWSDRQRAPRVARLAVPGMKPVPPRSVSPSAFLPVLPFAPTRRPRVDAVMAALSGPEGTIRRVEIPSGRIDRVVVHLQDVHGFPEAQRHIAAAVRRLDAARAVDWVALEGASGPIPIDEFQRFPAPAAAQSAARYLFRSGRISGPIFAALSSRRFATPIYGVEKPDLYARHVAALRAARADLADATRRAEAAVAKVDSEKDRVFSGDLAAFDEMVSQRAGGAMPIGEYAARLLGWRARSGATVDEGEAARFVEAYELERSIDFDRAEQERSEALARLPDRLAAGEIARLSRTVAAYRTGQLRHDDFYRALSMLCGRAEIDLDQFPSFAAFLRYIALADGVDAEALFASLDSIENAVWSRLARTDGERALITASRAAALRRRLASLTLTKRDWDRLREMETGREPIDGPHRRFYRLASLRDRALANGVRAGSPDAGTVVIVAGGFHAAGLRERLLDGRTAYIGWTPRISRLGPGDSRRHLSVFAQEKAPLDRLFEDPRVFLAPRPMSAAARRIGYAATALSGFRGNPSLRTAALALLQKTGRAFDDIRRAGRDAVHAAGSPGLFAVFDDEGDIRDIRPAPVAGRGRLGRAKESMRAWARRLLREIGPIEKNPARVIGLAFAAVLVGGVASLLAPGPYLGGAPVLVAGLHALISAFVFGMVVAAGDTGGDDESEAAGPGSRSNLNPKDVEPSAILAAQIAEAADSSDRYAETERRWAPYWTEHRRNLRELIDDSLRRVESRESATIIGGVTHDDLVTLARRFGRVNLIDIDAAAMHRARDALPDPLRRRVNVHAPVEISQSFERTTADLLAWAFLAVETAPTFADALRDIVALYHDFEFGGVRALSPDLRADFVMSSGVSSQVFTYPLDLIAGALANRFPDERPSGPEHQAALRAIVHKTVAAHLRLLMELRRDDAAVILWADTPRANAALRKEAAAGLIGDVASLIRSLRFPWDSLDGEARERLFERVSVGFPAADAEMRRSFAGFILAQIQGAPIDEGLAWITLRAMSVGVMAGFDPVRVGQVINRIFDLARDAGLMTEIYTVDATRALFADLGLRPVVEREWRWAQNPVGFLDFKPGSAYEFFGAVLVDAETRTDSFGERADSEAATAANDDVNEPANSSGYAGERTEEDERPDIMPGPIEPAGSNPPGTDTPLLGDEAFVETPRQPPPQEKGNAFIENLVSALATRDRHKVDHLLTALRLVSPRGLTRTDVLAGVRRIGEQRRLRRDETGRLYDAGPRAVQPGDWVGFFEETDPETGTPTGTLVAYDALYTDGVWHNSAGLILLTEDGRVVIQRQPGGYREISAAGDVEPGHEPWETALLEALEELDLDGVGLRLEEADLRPVAPPGGKPFFAREGATGLPRRFAEGRYEFPTGSGRHVREGAYVFAARISDEALNRLQARFADGETEEVAAIEVLSVDEIVAWLERGDFPPASFVNDLFGEPSVRRDVEAQLRSVPPLGPGSSGEAPPLGVMTVFHPFLRILMASPGAARTAVIPFAAAIGFIEEWLIRGLIFPALAGGVGEIGGIVMYAVLFAAVLHPVVMDGFGRRHADALAVCVRPKGADFKTPVQWRRRGALFLFGLTLGVAGTAVSLAAPHSNPSILLGLLHAAAVLWIFRPPAASADKARVSGRRTIPDLPPLPHGIGDLDGARPFEESRTDAPAHTASLVATGAAVTATPGDVDRRIRAIRLAARQA